MREIKFRAWDKRDNRMYFAFPNWCFSLDGDIFDRANTLIDLKKYIEVMQYTGLTDNSGKEIYEGDILKQFDDYDEPNNLFEVRWTDPINEKSSDATVSGFEFRKIKGYTDYKDFKQCYFQGRVEVIGNVWENPELLTGLPMIGVGE